MAFIYINAMAVLIGFELNVTIATLKSEKITKELTG
jgi:uncharacterized BrkB/YihY/UPF0761 family membrane protein